MRRIGSFTLTRDELNKSWRRRLSKGYLSSGNYGLIGQLTGVITVRGNINKL